MLVQHCWREETVLIHVSGRPLDPVVYKTIAQSDDSYWFVENYKLNSWQTKRLQVGGVPFNASVVIHAIKPLRN
jgi:hypothetical protein